MIAHRYRCLLVVASLCLAACTHADSGASWVDALAPEVDAIDTRTPGALGVYVHRLRDDSVFDHEGGRRWYLASTIKVPVAIAILQAVEEGRFSLDDELVLRESDFVDGAGDLLWHEPGARFSIATLIEKSIENSDSTATDMLIRHLGEDALNARVAQWADGFGPITTILQVRYDAYGALHPGVAELDNMQLVALRNTDAGAPRLAALREALGVESADLRFPSIDAAFEHYYAESDNNTATLRAFATVLTRLVEGELLNAAHTERLLGHMRAITTGARRIEAGLPEGTVFAQKTGTQIARACNVGVIAPGEAEATVVAACLERFDALPEAEAALQALGRALSDSGVLEADESVRR